MAGIQRLTLNSLNTEISNSVIIGLIIAKSTSRLFKSKKRENEIRGVWSCTLRDSDIDTINCSVWGSAHFVTSFDDMFHVGDVVDIINSRIKTREMGEKNEEFQPQVTSPFQLILNEGHSEMNIHEGDDFFQYLPLLHIPTKSPSGFLSLAYIQSHAQDIMEDTVDILVAVCSVSPSRLIKTKAGDTIQHREICVMDQTTTQLLKLMLWDTDTIKRAGSWQPKETILFISDVRLEWSDFNNSIVGRVNSRTVITEDPHMAEVEPLKEFAINASVQSSTIFNQMPPNIPDSSSIRNVMSIQQVVDRMNNSDHPQFTALLYCMVTQLDLDGYSKLFILRCDSCSCILKNSNAVCNNADCPAVSQNEYNPPSASFDIRVTLTDHTGSLSNCRLMGTYAEKILGCEIKKFMDMDIHSRGLLKWNLLLERCAAKIAVSPGPIISLVTCSCGDSNEVLNKIPIY